MDLLAPKYNCSFLRGAVAGCSLTTLLLVATWLVFRGVTLSLETVYGGGEADFPEGRSLLGFWDAGSQAAVAQDVQTQLILNFSAVSDSTILPVPSETTKRTSGRGHQHLSKNSPKKQLLVVVTSSRGLLGRTLKRIRSTWGRETANYKVVVGSRDGTPTYDRRSSSNFLISLDSKDLPAFPYLTISEINAVLDAVRSKFISQYKWFLFGPSNLYVSVQALERFLNALNPNRAVYIGHPNTSHGVQYCLGGPGFVLSQVALSKIAGECVGKNSAELGYYYLGRCFMAKLKTQCSIGNVSMLSDMFLHSKNALSLNPEILWKNKTAFGKMLTFYPIRDLHHMETIHAFSRSREIALHHDSALRLHDTLLESEDIDDDAFPMIPASIPVRNGSFDNFTKHCHIPSRGYVPEIRRKVVNWETVTNHKIFNSWNLSPRALVHGDLGKEIQFATSAALELLKKEMPRLILHSVANLYVRYKGTVGKEYIVDMTVANGSESNLVERRLSLLLPHQNELILKNNPPIAKPPPVAPSNLTLVNFIVPLDGLNRKVVAKFQRTYYIICVRKAENCRLIYVIFSSVSSDITFMRTYLTRFKRRHTKFNYEYVVGNGKFNLTKAYELGISKLEDDDLAFIASPKLSVADHFLGRCRMYATRGSKIYYPELFMYYNMPYVYRGKWHPRNYDYTRLHGRWATRGTICAYKSDFDAIGGYSTLYQWEMDPSSLHSPIDGAIEVVKAPDPGVSHWYEAMHCDSSLPPDQFSRCLSTQSDNLADRLSLAGYLLNLEAKCGENRTTS